MSITDRFWLRPVSRKVSEPEPLLRAPVSLKPEGSTGARQTPRGPGVPPPAQPVPKQQVPDAAVAKGRRAR